MLKTQKVKILNKTEIAKWLNNFFTNVDPNLATRIPLSDKSFKNYIEKNETAIENTKLFFIEYKKAYKSFKRNKTAGYDDIDFNVIIDVFEFLKFLFSKFSKKQEKNVSSLKNLKRIRIHHFKNLVKIL